jgi:predicted  nucleic acid-binding Zn-ribbon protein
LTTISPSTVADSFAAGRAPGSGTFFCLDCGWQLSLQESDRLPECPHCGGSFFRRDSIFEPMQEHGEQTAEFEMTTTAEPLEWLREARRQLPGSGTFLACRDEDEEIQIFALSDGWTRIGRSANADIRLDDPSVSRRHALIVCEDDSLRVLDDRSLNGVFLNGEVVEWGKLSDGDELTIGRYRLYALTA